VSSTGDAASASRRVVAAFDFDGTMIERDTLLPFLVEATSKRRVAAALGRDLAPTLTAAPRIGLRDAAKTQLLRRLLSGDDPQRLADLGRDYAERLHPRLRPAMVERVAWHRAAGHELVIVSASLGFYLEPLAERLSFDHVIAVGLVVGGDGRLTGALDGPNVRGEEKAVRLRRWMGDEPDELWAYGDSSGDADLLAMATHPRALSRRARKYVR
jgi:phosphatidylglycerophosphatase C